LVEVPVIILTGRHDISAKVTGFSLGAEDFLCKPFEPIELLMRVRTRIKGAMGRHFAETSWMKGDLRVDAEAHEVSVVTDHGETKLGLSPIDFKLLVHFLRHEGAVLTRDQIMSAGWGDNTYLGERTVDVHVSHLRKRLQDAGSMTCAIQSVHKVGYKLKISKAGQVRESMLSPV
jgi:DNA-binding response OmpR family regulator